MGEHGRGGAGQEHGAHLAEAHQGGQGQPGSRPRPGRIAERLDHLGQSRREKGDAARRIRNGRTERDTRQRERCGLTGEAAPRAADDPEGEPIEHARGDEHPAEDQHRHDEDPARRGEAREAYPTRRDPAKRPHRDRQESQHAFRQHLEGENGHHGAERPEGAPARRLQSRRRRCHPCHDEDQHGQRPAQCATGAVKRRETPPPPAPAHADHSRSPAVAGSRASTVPTPANVGEPHALAEPGGDRERDGGLLGHQSEKPAPLEAERLGCPVGPHGGRARPVRQEGDVPERRAPASRREPPIDAGIRRPDVVAERPVEHDVEGVPGIALAEDDLTRAEADVLEVRRQLGEGDPVEPGEQRHGRQDVGGIVVGYRGASHGPILRWPRRAAGGRARLDRSPRPGLVFRQHSDTRSPGGDHAVRRHPEPSHCRLPHRRLLPGAPGAVVRLDASRGGPERRP